MKRKSIAKNKRFWKEEEREGGGRWGRGGEKGRGGRERGEMI